MSSFKKILYIIGIVFCLIQVPAFSEGDLNVQPTSQATEQNADNMTDYAQETSVTTTPMTGEIDSKVVKSPYENNFQEKAPEQNEFTRAVFMFLKTMLAVALCSVIIYFLLLGVRKFYGVPSQNPQRNDKIEDNLKSTQNETEALQIFFNKTKNL